ncbi:MAG: DNA topoisomerase [Rhodocyclaceae bacterium]|nr:DNA topoisomerase [Rhodocyclaceae bacterium]
MRLIIAEKPSLGRSIAQALQQSFKPIKRGDQTVALQGQDCTITWVFGHILELAQPHEYDARYKRWSTQDLPILIQDWKLVAKEPAQLKLIGQLLRRADEVVHAGDPDREGQLLIDEVLQHLGWRGKTLRLLPHATDEQSLRKAWSRLQPNEKFRPLYEAALCRQRADWLVGINASRAATLLLTSANQLVPLGRVMTPTLALVVQRDRAIENFRPQTFWRVAVRVRDEAGHTAELLYDPQPHLLDRAKAEQILKALKPGSTAVLHVRTRRAQERAPLPWHLGDFQRAMQQACGTTLQQSLQILQHLYEQQLVSYPRTDCRYLPEEHKASAVALLLKTLPALGQQAAPVRALQASLQPKDYIYDNRKVAEHHGLVPTGKVEGLQQLTALQQRAYCLIVQHYAKTLLPHHDYEETELQLQAAGVEFGAKGRRSLNWTSSWRLFEPLKEEMLPPFAHGCTVWLQAAELKQGTTTAPQRYTEATLAADMEAVAKYVTDERIKARLKETSGIGTAATRAAIVEKLKEKGMLQTQRKGKTAELISTPFGRQVVDAVPRILTDVGLTAAWEEALEAVAQQRYDAKEFIERVQRMVASLVQRMRKVPGRPITQAAAAAPQHLRAERTADRSTVRRARPRRTSSTPAAEPRTSARTKPNRRARQPPRGAIPAPHLAP